METSLPDYRSLPRTADGVGSAWGLFGPGDSTGLVHLLTAERVRSAVSSVRTGTVFPLDLPVGYVTPSLFQRGTARHTVIERRPGRGLDDALDNYYPQSGSQWDSLGHAPYAPDVFYGGATAAEVKRGERNTIDHWARHGMAGRGILLDLADVVAERGGPGASVALTVADFERALAATGLTVEPGDVLLFRTGFTAWYAEQTADVRERMGVRGGLSAAGIEHSEEMAAFLWDLHIAGIASDAPAVEVFPPDNTPEGEPFGNMHRILIGQFGLALGELWQLDALAAHCRARAAHDFLLVSAPLNVPGGIGSPANAVAIA